MEKCWNFSVQKMIFHTVLHEQLALRIIFTYVNDKKFAVCSNKTSRTNQNVNQAVILNRDSEKNSTKYLRYNIT